MSDHRLGERVAARVPAAAKLGAAAALGRAIDRHMLVLAIAAAAVMSVPGVVIGARWANGPAGNVAVFAALAFAFLAGYRIRGIIASVLALIALAFGASAGDLTGAIVAIWVFTVPPWAIGRIMRSRSLLSAQLAEQARELDAEREASARESVRYERTRIARDLHDSVGHNLSMIVIQAAAARRALATNPDVAVQSLRHIEGGAQRAEVEIGKVLGLLADERAGADGVDAGGLRAIDELVRGAMSAGLSVHYSFRGKQEHLPSDTSDVVYRVVQEAITNALKHAPGAAIEVEITVGLQIVSIAVQNGAPASARQGEGGLAGVGGSFGISGMTDRVAALGGTLDAASTPDGGWRLAVELPLDADDAVRLP